MRKIFTLIIIIFSVSNSFAQWVNLDSIPQARASSASFSIGDTAYVVAGGGSCGCYLNTAYAYFRASDTWSTANQISAYPSGFDDSPVGFAIGDSGYVGLGATGGYQFSNSFYKYDPHTNTWTPSASIPGPGVSSGVAFVINGKAYAGGGFTGYYIPEHQFYVYDPTLGYWDTIAPCPAKGVAVNAVAFSLNGKGYVGTGGYMSQGSTTWIPQQDFWSYDPTTNTWDSIAPYPGGGRMGGFAFTSCNQGFVGGGVSDAQQQMLQKDVWAYDPNNGPLGTWTRVADFSGYGVYRPTSIQIGRSGYVCAGNFSPSGADLWEYAPVSVPSFAAPTTTCTGQSVTFTDTSNYAPTNWQWSFPGATPNSSTLQNPVVVYDSAGTFDVTLTAWNACDSGTQMVTGYITVGVGGNLTATASPTSICSSQSSTLSVTGGSGTYAWSPTKGLTDSTSANITATPTITTTYTVSSAGGGGCAATGQVVLTVGNNTIGGMIGASRDTICSGTTGLLQLTGNSSTTIQWQSSTDGINFTNLANNAIDTTKYRTLPLLQSTWFTAEVGSGMCSAMSDTLELIVPPSLTALFTSTSSGLTSSFNSSGSKGDIHSYYWDFGDGNTSTSANPSHTYAKDSTYNVCLTIYDGSNCSYTYCRDVALGVPTISAQGSWSIYPDPFSSELNVDAKAQNSGVESIVMYNVLGQQVLNEIEGHNDNTVFHLDVSSLPKGMYYLVIRTASADYVQKLVK